MDPLSTDQQQPMSHRRKERDLSRARLARGSRRGNGRDRKLKLALALGFSRIAVQHPRFGWRHVDRPASGAGPNGRDFDWKRRDWRQLSFMVDYVD
jgi:hypothetical protein